MVKYANAQIGFLKREHKTFELPLGNECTFISIERSEMELASILDPDLGWASQESGANLELIISRFNINLSFKPCINPCWMLNMAAFNRSALPVSYI